MQHFISQEEYDDFMNEEDTSPFTRVTAAQRELDTAESVVAQFTGRAQSLGYSVQPGSWHERLAQALNGEMEPEELSFFEAQ